MSVPNICFFCFETKCKLTVTTSHGKAWVNLNVGLGCPEDPPPQPAEGSKGVSQGNSCHRFHERSEGNRVKVAQEEKDEPKAAEQVVDDEFCPDTVFCDDSSKWCPQKMMTRTTSRWGKC